MVETRASTQVRAMADASGRTARWRTGAPGLEAELLIPILRQAKSREAVPIAYSAPVTRDDSSSTAFLFCPSIGWHRSGLRRSWWGSGALVERGLVLAAAWVIFGGL